MPLRPEQIPSRRLVVFSVAAAIVIAVLVILAHS